MATLKRLVDRGLRLGRVSVVLRAQPAEGVERALEHLMSRRDRRGPPWRYDPTDAGEERLTSWLGPLSAEDADTFQRVWQRALSDLQAQGLRLGRGAYGHWDDADIRLGQLAWHLTRRLAPEYVVETGVARGLTTRVILEALERNGHGTLWSIDLPPLVNRELSAETAAAVPPALRHRWKLLLGSSRRRLPSLISQLPRVDLFVHDSMHTTRNVSFELDQAWKALRRGGAILVDDVERNRATAEFLQSHTDALGVICKAADERALIGVLLKPTTQLDERGGHTDLQITDT